MTTYEQWLEITEQIKTLTVELSEVVNNIGCVKLF